MRRWTIAIIVLAAGVGAARAEAPIRLRCDGFAAGTKTRTNYLATGRISTSISDAQFRERLLFEMTDGVARVHLPRSLVPQLNSGSDDNWWPVSDLHVTDDAIEGRFRLNLVNKPSFRIDRVNGDIDLHSPMGEAFRGQCESNLGAARKF